VTGLSSMNHVGEPIQPKDALIIERGLPSRAPEPPIVESHKAGMLTELAHYMDGIDKTWPERLLDQQAQTHRELISTLEEIIACLQRPSNVGASQGKVLPCIHGCVSSGSAES